MSVTYKFSIIIILGVLLFSCQTKEEKIKLKEEKRQLEVSDKAYYIFYTELLEQKKKDKTINFDSLSNVYKQLRARNVDSALSYAYEFKKYYKLKNENDKKFQRVIQKEEQDSQTNAQYENPEDVIGEYADMCPGMTTGTITISKAGKEYLFKETFTGGRKDYSKSLKYKNIGGKHYFFIIASEAGDYYVLEKNGDLSSYDRQGYISYALRKR
jgi:hypothetical protein